MNLKFFAFAFLIFCNLTSLAGEDPNYSVALIPAGLMKDMNAVVREDRMKYTILAPGKAHVQVYYAVTILNAKAQHHATFVEDYDRLSKITDINASVYDANGKQIKKLKNKEIQDQSVFDGVSLFTDARLKRVDLRQGAYPYTVVFEYEKDYNFLLYIDGSTVVTDERFSVQNFSYELVFPENLTPRYKAVNMPVEPVKAKHDNGLISLSWKLQNILPFPDEPLAPSETYHMGISAAPVDFEYDGYAGKMSSWDDFGKWIHTLNKGRNDLPLATREHIARLTANAKTTEEKVSILYDYLQSRTRYVGIQLGIGGWQPFQASVVDKTGYGDCKALSNYMVSMLESIGIKAHYALIYAGENYRELDVTFPSSQFNHAIVAVPNAKDTLWLECTSQTNPTGYQGTFTGDRKALLITDNGAAVVRTTAYPAQVNVQSRTAEVMINDTGDATATVRTTYSGLQYENDDLHFMVNRQPDDQKKWLQSNIGIPSFDINSFSFTNNKSRIPSAVVKVDLSLRKYASVSGKRFFITPNLMNRNTYVPRKLDERKLPVVRRTGYVDVDTIHYTIPESIYAEFLPSPVVIKSPFGEYESSFSVEQGKLTYIRRLKMNKGEFPAESYDQLIEFFKGVTKADNTKAVFMSKT